MENNFYSPSCDEATFLIESEKLPVYFCNLHEHLTSNNLLQVKKYEILNDGLYVMLKGQVSFMFNSSVTEREGEMTKSKSHFKGTSGTSLVQQVFSVFESSFKNCTALEESYLLKI